MTNITNPHDVFDVLHGPEDGPAAAVAFGGRGCQVLSLANPFPNAVKAATREPHIRGRGLAPVADSVPRLVMKAIKAPQMRPIQLILGSSIARSSYHGLWHSQAQGGSKTGGCGHFFSVHCWSLGCTQEQLYGGIHIFLRRHLFGG